MNIIKNYEIIILLILLGFLKIYRTVFMVEVWKGIKLVGSWYIYKRN